MLEDIEESELCRQERRLPFFDGLGDFEVLRKYLKLRCAASSSLLVSGAVGLLLLELLTLSALPFANSLTGSAAIC